MNKIPDDLIPIGKIIKPYGVKGQIKFKPYNESSNVLKKDINVWLKKKDDKDLDFQFFKIDSINYTSLQPIIKFNQFNNRDEALELRDYILYISRSLFNDSEDIIYFVDFIGCKIYDDNKSFIGIAKDILHFKENNHVMIVQNESKEFMIPIRNDLIKLFDVKKKCVIIEIIDGLVDKQ